MRDTLERFDVRPRNAAALIDWLSGGNQQKIFVGRWLATGAEALHHGGADGRGQTSAREVSSTARCAASQTTAQRYSSSPPIFEEVAALCDRALVIGARQDHVRVDWLDADAGRASHPLFHGGRSERAGALMTEKDMSETTFQRSAASPARPAAPTGSLVQSGGHLRPRFRLRSDHAGVRRAEALELLQRHQHQYAFWSASR